MTRSTSVLLAALTLTACAVVSAASELSIEGRPVQGGLIFGRTSPNATVTLDGQTVMVSDQGRFVIGFGRDEQGTRTLRIEHDGELLEQEWAVQARDYRIERVDGLPPATVTPDASVQQRIRDEQALVVQARSRRDSRTDYTHGFIWPAQGRLSGFYGSQRILNGQPRRPHYGLDIAAPTGTPVVAPAAGIITLTHPNMFYSGGTIILDHGHGLSSTFLHLSAIEVEAGTRVEQGQLIGRIGATGRATGPHLDWRMNWLNRRVDPQPLLAPPSDQSSIQPSRQSLGQSPGQSPNKSPGQ